MSNAVRTRLSPTTIGEENPLGTGTFHFTFLSGPNSTGGFCPSATPDPPGPRNCGQASGLSAPIPTAATVNSAIDAMNFVISMPSIVLVREFRSQDGRGFLICAEQRLNRV